ncbi:MAG TPA: O-antigen ligase family protein [Thermoanaerobaculia bacterium]|nr:O-antigen ligase family protein [Thermoanaerobaculia bacterium]
MKRSTTLDVLRELREQPRALRIAAGLYLLHVLVQGKTTPSELSAFLTILFLGWALARRELRPSFHILYFPLLLYGIASTTSALVNGVTISAYADAIVWFKMLIFPTALILFRTVPRLRHLALLAQIVFAVGISLSGIAQYVSLHQPTLETRITGPSTHVMTYSGLLLPAALFLLVLWAHRKGVWLGAATLVVSLALFLTYTRSVWLGWAVAVFVLLLIKRSRWLPYAVAAALVFVTLMPMNFFARMVSTFDLQQSSNLDRIRMAEAGVEMIKDQPVFGVGPAFVKESYPLYRKADAPRFRPPHLHNNVIQLWAERGVLGLMAYITLMALFLRECARGWRGPSRPFAEAGVAITVGLAVAGMFEFNFGDTEVFYLTLELMALIVAFLERPAGLAMNEVGERVVAGDPEPVPSRP